MARVLWISGETPDRHGQGGQRRQFHQIVALAELGHQIRAVTLPGPQSSKSLSEIIDVIRPRIDILGTDIPWLYRRQRRLIESQDCDAIVVSHVESAWMVRGLKLDVPKLLDVHNVTSDWLLRKGREDESRQAWALEDSAARSVTAIMTCSDVERDRWRDMHQGLNQLSFTAPLGVDPHEWPDCGFDRASPIVALFGSWGWEPNQDGLEWFSKDVWPAVRARYPEARALVAGTGVSSSFVPAEGLECVGRVPSIAEFTAQATVIAVPVIFGVGAPVKFAESLASGAAVAATVDGASAFNDTLAFVSDDSAEWVDWLVARLKNRATEPVPNEAREFALSRLTWQAAVRPIDQWLRQL